MPAGAQARVRVQVLGPAEWVRALAQGPVPAQGLVPVRAPVGWGPGWGTVGLRGLQALSLVMTPGPQGLAWASGGRVLR